MKKGHIGTVEKAQKTSLDSDNNLIPISVPIHFMDDSFTCIYRCLQFRSLANCYYL